jgi:CHAD domain-containing protein
MAKLPRHLLERSPEETARRLCLALVDEASAALERMNDADDSEALHDFRVSLRRLRSLMRAYRRHLRGSATRKLRARIKTLAGTTNDARDAEVQIEWLTKEGKRLGEPGISGANYLIAALVARQATTPSATTLRRAFRPLRRDLTKALSRVRLLDEHGSSNFVRATGKLIRDHAEVLEASLDAAHSAEDAELLHRARIEAKRLRYLLEPLQNELEDARPLIKRMKSLQDCLGELQDTRVMTEEISSALESSALDEARKLRDLALAEGDLPEAYPPQNPGLLALLKAQRTRRDRAFTNLTVAWTGNAAHSYFALVERFVEQLVVWPGGELPKRRFLLAHVPPEIGNERVRASREGRSVRYTRVVEKKEEPLTRRGFDAFWSLTEGRRLEYRCYELRDGARSWSVVSIPELGIVLAVVDGSADAPIPEPIQRELVREVTGVKKYEPEALARATRR